MTEQEAKALCREIVLNYAEEGEEEYFEALDMAISYLDKQIPMRVKEVHIDEYFCPACYSENNCNDGIVEDRYCPVCGQRLF